MTNETTSLLPKNGKNHLQSNGLIYPIDNLPKGHKTPVFVLICLILFVGILLIFTPKRVISDLNPSTILDSNGLRIRLKAVENNNLYVRVNTPSSDLILVEKFPRYQSSTFEMFFSEVTDCFSLRSLDGFWLRVQSDLSLASTERFHIFATEFSAYYPDSTNKKILKIRLCETNRFLELKTLQPKDKLPFMATESTSQTRALRRSLIHENLQSEGLDQTQDFDFSDNEKFVQDIVVEHKKPKDTRHYSVVAQRKDSYFTFWSPYRDGISIENDIQRASVNGTVFEIETVTQFRGVNLGGWFIPEVWMLSSFFNNTGLGWGGSLCAMVNYSLALTEQRMKQHLKTWITESDFKQISEIGFNSVRLPIGYWNIMDDPYRLYAPTNFTDSLNYIDWTFEMAVKYNLTVLLDLHGVPGSQNCQDHSGCGYTILGQPQWTKPRNIQLTLQAINTICKRYIHHPNLLGIELMNEPSQYMSENNHTLLSSYYQKAYRLIRSYSHTTLVVFNELYEHLYSKWDDVMLEPDYYNVMVDWHLYDWQGPHNDEPRRKHLEHARNWAKLIDTFSVKHPILIGEWSMSTGTKMQVGQEFVNSCVGSFLRSSGWYIWNWKIDHTLGYYEWDVKYEHDKLNGLSAMKYFNITPPTDIYT